MYAKDLMSARPSTCKPEETLADAASRMWGRDCGFVPVVDAKSGALMGVVTDRDIAMAAFTQGVPIQGLRIAANMRTRVATCRDTDALFQVMNIMRDKAVRRLPVLDAGNAPIGVISINDVARFAAAPEGAHLRDQLLKTFAGICTPRHETSNAEASATT